jgi:hypothetical protein
VVAAAANGRPESSLYMEPAVTNPDASSTPTVRCLFFFGQQLRVAQ